MHTYARSVAPGHLLNMNWRRHGIHPQPCLKRNQSRPLRGQRAISLSAEPARPTRVVARAKLGRLLKKLEKASHDRRSASRPGNLKAGALKEIGLDKSRASEAERIGRDAASRCYLDDRHRLYPPTKPIAAVASTKPAHVSRAIQFLCGGRGAGGTGKCGAM